MPAVISERRRLCADGKHSHLRQQVCEPVYLAITVEQNLSLDDPVLFAAKLNEIMHGQKVQVGRLIPIVWKEMGSRRPSADQVRKAS